MKKYRWLGIASLILTMLLFAPAVQAKTVAYGKCGAERSFVTWVLNEEGTLLISGSGAMKDFEDEAPWSSHDTEIKKVVIEEGVTNISSHAFNSCGLLIEAEIPGSVIMIGEGAFSNCRLMKTVSLSSGLEVLGKSAFSSCYAMTEIAIPDTVTTIGDEAFAFCRRLAGISIPANVTEIGKRVFRNCRSLKEITVAGNNPVYDSRNNCSAIIYSASDTLVAGCKGTVIPQSVTAIDDWAFFASSIEEITLPDSIERIGENAFCMCSKLTGIHIPRNVEYIGAGAFGCCEILRDITVDERNTVYDSRNNCRAIIHTGRDKLIVGCADTMIPYTVVSIGESAFNGCGLKKILIPAGIKKIGSYAFDNNWELTDIYYRGSEEQWKKIFIEEEGVGSSVLKDVTIHYNYSGRGEGYTGTAP